MELFSIMELQDRRIRRLEGTVGVEIRQKRKEAQEEALQVVSAEIAARLKKGEELGEVMKDVVSANPALALKVARKAGIKLI